VGEDGVERLPAAGVVVAVPRRPTKVLQFTYRCPRVIVSEKEGLERREGEVIVRGGRRGRSGMRRRRGRS
jgi:hypothetical protein